MTRKGRRHNGVGKEKRIQSPSSPSSSAPPPPPPKSSATSAAKGSIHSTSVNLYFPQPCVSLPLSPTYRICHPSGDRRRRRRRRRKMPASKTVSTGAAETDLGTHVFHVVGYSQQKAICAHKDTTICSGRFSVGGHDWVLGFMTDIDDKDHPGCIAISLILLNPVAAGVLASFELRLVNQEHWVILHSAQGGTNGVR